ncbi:carbohydrate ABC transporter permease [Mycoplasmopsis canis]|uniref:ABC-type maltose transport systems, permease component n=1 Tax=Mycoplasmopsis canis TaxID=29555 RepID=A0A0F6X1V5_9BACT|nr:carbohydrate ABC transporter permease [Mycoplasmopsis canis]AKF41121.1 ABC transporter permease [Mycoplasmopsis canis]AMD81234.1 ABC transporter permease [Mycoplasmopsis canis PG 14]EIE40627.1 ABC transporter permease protein [Mycoplasmopsis canis PG 14]EIE40769.1 ABC transporter permease protein [Mycoplasmopsis canis UF33]VEU68795.1 ABC-type maltose transport systems, permease component [Mycoplasmopsis canis]
MFELKLKLQKLLIAKKLRRNQETVSSQVTEKNLINVVASVLLKLFLLSFFGLVIIFPFIFMINISLMTDDEAEGLKRTFQFASDFTLGKTYFVQTDPNSTGGFEIKPWAEVVQNTYDRAISSGYWQSLMVTSVNVLLSVFFKIFITFLMGYAFSLRNWRFKGLIWFLALALLVLPEVALLSGQYTVVVKTNLRSSLFTVLLAMVLPFSASIFNTVMYKNAFEAIPGRIKEVSLVDGAGGMKYLFKVAFPMVVPTTLTIVILTALASWNAYLWPSIVNSDNKDWQLISVWLFKAGLDERDVTAGANVQLNIRMAAAIIVILPMFIIYLLFRKRIMNAISRQGSTIKG